MDLQRIAHAVDHTLLDPCCTTEQIEALCREAKRFEAASVCVPPCHVAAAAGFLDGALPVCTVIGFPNGYSTRAVKCAETREAIALGASEIDMVANLCRVREGRFDLVEEEIAAVKEACAGRILPTRKSAASAPWWPQAEPTISRPPRASAGAAPPLRTWPCCAPAAPRP